METSYPCSICNEECHESCIECSNCKRWVHFECTMLNASLVQEWGKGTRHFVCKKCAFSQGNCDYQRAFIRIQNLLSSSFKQKKSHADSELLLMNTYHEDFTMSTVSYHDSPGYADKVSQDILEMFQPGIARQYLAKATVGDGNCLYRTVSLRLFGNEEGHLKLRFLTALEMMRYPEYYDMENRNYKGQLIDDRIITSDYKSLLSMAMKPGSFSETMHIYALSAAIGVPITTFCSPQTMFQSPFSRVVAGRDVRSTQEPQIIVMWTQIARTKPSCQIIFHCLVIISITKHL